MWTMHDAENNFWSKKNSLGQYWSGSNLGLGQVKTVVLPFLEFSLVLERNHRHLNALIFLVLYFGSYLRTRADERAAHFAGR